jgi:cytochrome c553
LFILAVLLLTGCGRRASQADPPSYRPLGPTNLFADGASARPLVTGVVPRPADRSPGIPYVTVNSPGPAQSDERVPDSKIPFPVTDAMIRRGQERFDINCVACHGRAGDGNGIVVQRGFTHPPSFYSRMLIDCPDSHIYNVMTNGKGAMFSVNDRVTPDDRWAIVAYIRTMQEGARRAPAATGPASSGGAAQ